MIHAALLLAVVLQGSDLRIEVSSRKAEGGFEARIAGRGAALDGLEMVGLRFHRRVNRVEWSDGTLRTETLEEPWGRCAHVRDGTFVHRERFRAPVDVELRLILDGEKPDHVRTLRVGTGADVARQLERDVRDVSGALGTLGKIGSETAKILEAKRPSKSRARILIGRLERLRLTFAELEETALTTASIDAALNLVSDLHQAAEGIRAGKSCDDMRLSLSGEVISPESVAACLAGLSAVLEREQALTVVRSVSALCDGIESAAFCGRGADRRRRGVERSLLALQVAAEKDGLLEMRTAAGTTPADLVAGTEEYFNLAVSAAICPGLSGPDLDQWHCWLYEQIGELEERLRNGP